MAKTAKDTTAKPGLIARLVRFVRQVIAELKKAVRPTRQELFTYASVVVVFVMMVMAFIWIVDTLLGRGVLALFG